MDSRENLRDVVTSIIKSDMDAATVALNAYLETKSAEIIDKVTTNSDWSEDFAENNE